MKVPVPPDGLIARISGAREEMTGRTSDMGPTTLLQLTRITPMPATVSDKRTVGLSGGRTRTARSREWTRRRPEMISRGSPSR